MDRCSGSAPLTTEIPTVSKFSGTTALAKRAKMPPTSIAHFESGSRKPSFDTLRRLANALEVTTDYLLGRVDQPELAEAGDPLFRDVGKLSGRDRELAKDFLEMLAKRNEA